MIRRDEFNKRRNPESYVEKGDKLIHKMDCIIDRLDTIIENTEKMVSNNNIRIHTGFDSLNQKISEKINTKESDKTKSADDFDKIMDIIGSDKLLDDRDFILETMIRMNPDNLDDMMVLYDDFLSDIGNTIISKLNSDEDKKIDDWLKCKTQSSSFKYSNRNQNSEKGLFDNAEKNSSKNLYGMDISKFHPSNIPNLNEYKPGSEKDASIVCNIFKPDSVIKSVLGEDRYKEYKKVCQELMKHWTDNIKKDKQKDDIEVKTKEKTIFCILGESGSGKDSLVNYTLDKYGLDLKLVVSYTDREMRKYERDGEEHFFIDKDTMTSLLHQFDEIVAYTKIGDVRYCATLQEVEKSDIYIIDPDGLKLFKEMCSETFNIISIYIDCPIEERRKRTQKRGDKSNNFESRTIAEDKQFAKFRAERGYDYIIDTGDLTTLDEASQKLIKIFKK